MKIKELKHQYETICNEWIKAFCKKQGIHIDYFDGWTGNEVGSIAGFYEQHYFNLSDIILDLETNQKKGFIQQWQNDGVDYSMTHDKDKFINYKSYIKGLRYKDLK